jgi:Rps23 Pro-64 3,4-dihydroxylase Tpa1-like proline 4-hydroxylase
MKCYIINEPVPYLLMEDVYSEEELKLVHQELEFLHPKLQNPEFTESASITGDVIKNNTGIFLDSVYLNRNFSDILRINRKFFRQEVFDLAALCHPSLRLIQTSKRDSTLISYYDNGDYYKPHIDSSTISIVGWVYKEPKNFTGGDFFFSDYNIKVEPKNNSFIMFLSCYKHEVDEVIMTDSNKYFSGRFSITTFCAH